MQVHTFRAESLQAALQQVRQSLGPDASILQTREKRQGRMGPFSKWVIEVEATLDAPAESRLATHSRSALLASSGRGNEPPTGSSCQIAVSPSGEELADAHSSTAGSAERRQPALPADHNSRTTKALTSPALLEVHAELLAGGVTAQLASALLSEVERLIDPLQREDAWAIRGRIGQVVGSKLKVSGSMELNSESRERPAVVALVGPTGVGKTTTLAKIAAGFRFDLGCRVGLIALDTFRLGAVDQLLQYAELISAPLEVVSAPEQVTEALERLSQCDLVLLDTAGRAPRDSDQLLELRKFLALAQPDATHLVVSATSSLAYVDDMLRHFSVLKPTNLLITKLDETVGFGSWLSLLHTCQLPVSYLTTGQHVPQDIVVASARRLTSLLLGAQSQASAVSKP